MGRVDPSGRIDARPRGVAEEVGRVLGRKGETVKLLERDSGAKIDVDKTTGPCFLTKVCVWTSQADSGSRGLAQERMECEVRTSTIRHLAAALVGTFARQGCPELAHAAWSSAD